MLPVRGATSGVYLVAVNSTISIHAPRAGSDLPVLRQKVEDDKEFQSMLPVRGATKPIDEVGLR